MALELSTIGTKLFYKVETTAGTFPTSSYTEIANIISISEDNGEPEQIEVTNLVDTRHRSIPGLLGSNDVVSITANFTEAFKTAWATLVSAYKAGAASSKATWFEMRLPGHTDSWYFAGIPSELGFPGAEVAQAQQITAYITKNDNKGWATSST